MEANLDMNSNRVLNLPEPTSDSEPYRKVDIDSGIGPDITTVASNISDVSTVATDISDVSTVASDLTGDDTVGSVASLIVAGSPGFISVASAGTANVRSLISTGNGLSVSNADGASGNPTFSLSQDLRTSASPEFAGLTLNGVGFSPTGAVVGQALGYPNSSTTVEPYTPAGGGDTLAAADEEITGDWGFPGWCAFTSRTAAEAGDTHSAEYLHIGDLVFVADGSGTALTTGDGRTWSPAGTVYPDHFAENTTPKTTDMTSAINAALAFSKEVRLKPVQYRITGQIEVPEGTTLFGASSTSGAYLDNVGAGAGNGALREEGGSFLWVDFGNGIDDSTLSTYYANAAVLLNNGSGIIGVSFWYPGQDMELVAPAAPTAYPPAIAASAQCRGAVIERVNLGNAYVGIDAWRDHGHLYINEVVGFPIYRGIILGSMEDNDYVTNVHWAGRRVFFNDQGESWQESDLPEWIDENGTGFYLGRVTWTRFKNCFAIGYNYGFELVSQSADAGNDINTAGAVQNCSWVGCGFDSVRVGIKGTGAQGRLSIIACEFAPLSLYDASATGLAGIDLDNTGGTVTDVTIMSCHFWAVRENCIKLTDQPRSKIIGNTIYEVGNTNSGTGILLDNCDDSVVANNTVDCVAANNNTNRGIDAIRSDRLIIDGNTVLNFDSNPIRIDVCDDCQVINNVGSGNDLELYTDANSTKKYYNLARNNRDENTPFYDNTDVTSSILEVPLGLEFLSYSGTSGVSGLPHGFVGQKLTIRFAAPCTLTSEDAGVNQEQRLFLTGDFSASAGDTIDLVSAGSLGWYEKSRAEDIPVFNSDLRFAGNLGNENGVTLIDSSGNHFAEGTLPYYSWYETDAGADQKRWRLQAQGAAWQLITRTDADAFTATVLDVDRSGNLDISGSYSSGGTSGVTGTFVDNGGNTITVTGGVITGLS
jgi:hypothetical protein